jgi:acyl carrier protein
MDRTRVIEIVLNAVVATNMGRAEGQKLEVSATAPLFGAQSPLDSLGLVALLIDVEEAFANQGHSLVLSDERALSQRRSPFRDIPSLVDYIERLLTEQAA